MRANPKDAAKNAKAGLKTAIRIPAAAGAIIRVPDQIAEFNATALTSAERATKCGKRALLAD